MAELENRRQEEFCQQYIIDFNGFRAAVDAKYAERSARVTASRLLTKANILKRIAELLKERSERTKITQDMVLYELVGLLTSDIRDFVEVEEGGSVRIKPFSEIPEGKTRVIKSIKEDRIMKDDPKSQDDAIIIHDKITYSLHGKEKAIELAMKHLGMLIEKIEFPKGIPMNIKAAELIKIAKSGLELLEKRNNNKKEKK